MNRIHPNRLFQVIPYTLPFIIILSMIWLVKSPIFKLNAGYLAPAVIADLIITLPLTYFLIIRKKSIPKTTIIPVLIIGVIIAGRIVPLEHQALLNLAKIWVLPVVELFVITYVFFTIRKSVKAFKAQKTGQLDFHHNLKLALSNILPKKLIPFATMEISVFYYGFIKWKSLKIKAHEFTYHKESGIRAVLAVVLFLVAIETFALHILFIQKFPLFTWILTGVSLYSGIQVFGILKSLKQRPISIENEQISLKYGILSEAIIDMGDIEDVLPLKRELENEDDIISFSPFGQLEGHNVQINLKKSITIYGLYGTKKVTNRIALFLDEPEIFIALLEQQIK